MPTKPRRKYAVTPEEFVAAWSACETTSEVAIRLSMPKNIVLARASTYRKRGVRLKTMKRVNIRRLDIDRLNELATGAPPDDSGIPCHWDDHPGITVADL
jgi:hypothetical protein